MAANTTNENSASLEKRVARLEARLHDLEDQEQIRECLARYGYAADLGRSEEWLDLWTADGVYDLDDAPYQGRDALTKIIMGGVHKGIENRCLHTVGNLFIRVDGDDAWAEGYSVVFFREREDDRYIPWSCGYNHWDFRRVDGEWKMVRRYRRAVGDKAWGGTVIAEYQKEAAR
jgi:hypothetical protein